MRVIAVGNQKGGVAKTTTCLSLGGVLAEKGRTVLLLDLDPQANLTQSLGIQPGSLRRSVSDALLHNATLVSVSQETAVMGLDIVPANAGLASIDRALYRCCGYEWYLKDAISELDGALYDHILIDCPPSFNPLTLNALTAAEMMIIPVQAEYYAVQSLQHVFELIKLVRLKTNPALHYRLLITMYDRRNSIMVKILERMRRIFPQALLDTIIEVDTKLRESPVVGQPITAYDPVTRGARQYRALAEELLDHE